MKISEMPAGREMDVMVAKYIMVGMELASVMDCFGCPMVYKDDEITCCPHYSTDIAAAWEVAERVRLTVTPAIGHGWEAAWCNASGSGERNWVGTTNGRKWHYGDTAPLAICRAALLAMGVSEI